MSKERRYHQEEIAAIFKQAAEAQEAAQRNLSPSEGLTLAELQQIGKEAGITPAFIAQAAAAVDQTNSTLPSTTYFGLPISVARTVDLPGPFSETDWEQLVVDLRHTFQATGEIRRDGSLRQWKNGNLQALIEPTESGHRLTLRTRKGNAPPALLGGFALLVLGLMLVLIMGFSKGFRLVDETFIATLFAVLGLGIGGSTILRLPGWIEERGQQMEQIAARVRQRLATRQDSAPSLDPDVRGQPDDRTLVNANPPDHPHSNQEDKPVRTRDRGDHIIE